jgi:lysophospholipase
MIGDSGGAVHWLEAGNGIRLRAAHWPEGPRGIVLLLNGRTEFIEKHLESVADWQQRGFAVWTLDWRGQGLSSRLLPDRLKHHVDRFEAYLEDVDLLLDTLVLPSLGGRKLLVMAHSMGGHLAARLLARRPDLFAAGILCAPMIDFLRGGPALRWFARTVFQVGCLVPGRALAFGPGTSPRPNLDRPFVGNKLTTCPDRHQADLALLRAQPDLQLGGCSWGWLRAATQSMAVLLRPATLRKISMPVLVAVSDTDRVIDVKAVRMFARRLARCELVFIEGAEHELWRETDARRAQLWQAVDGFLTHNLL